LAIAIAVKQASKTGLSSMAESWYFEAHFECWNFVEPFEQK
jgi:hypothetical protein